ncbi:MAG: hypothetical protein H0V82_13060 [Candidatus Protochlamydia sp.]|nr:hypothetical protein [Candidatus Protochlamydia sp.]
MKNKITMLMLFVTAASLLLTLNEVEARGGGGRGGGGRAAGGRAAGGAGEGAAAYRGGHTMNRTPTMSRASTMPAASQARVQAQTRPAVTQSRVQQQALQQRPSVANQAQLRSQVNQYTQSLPAQNINRQAFTQQAQNFSSARGSQIAQNRQISDRVSQNVRQSQPNSSRWFDQNFLTRHNVGRDYAGAGNNLWRPAAWSTLASWGAWGWSTPYYYDDAGYAYPVTASESTFANPSSSIEAPYQPVQMYPPAQSAQTTVSPEGEWLPLGIFAVASNANTAAQSNRFIQLAVSRSGEIAGILYNSATDKAQDLTGKIDPNSQKAYWSLTSQTGSPIASTGIYNLTEDQTPFNVHFLDGTDQTWTLVRLKGQ